MRNRLPVKLMVPPARPHNHQLRCLVPLPTTPAINHLRNRSHRPGQLGRQRPLSHLSNPQSRRRPDNSPNQLDLRRLPGQQMSPRRSCNHHRGFPHSRLTLGSQHPPCNPLRMSCRGQRASRSPGIRLNHQPLRYPFLDRSNGSPLISRILSLNIRDRLQTMRSSLRSPASNACRSGTHSNHHNSTCNILPNHHFQQSNKAMGSRMGSRMGSSTGSSKGRQDHDKSWLRRNQLASRLLSCSPRQLDHTRDPLLRCSSNGSPRGIPHCLATHPFRSRHINILNRSSNRRNLFPTQIVLRLVRQQLRHPVRLQIYSHNNGRGHQQRSNHIPSGLLRGKCQSYLKPHPHHRCHHTARHIPNPLGLRCHSTSSHSLLVRQGLLNGVLIPFYRTLPRQYRLPSAMRLAAALDGLQRSRHPPLQDRALVIWQVPRLSLSAPSYTRSASRAPGPKHRPQRPKPMTTCQLVRSHPAPPTVRSVGSRLANLLAKSGHLLLCRRERPSMSWMRNLQPRLSARKRRPSRWKRLVIPPQMRVYQADAT